jgi:hypothetical protein
MTMMSRLRQAATAVVLTGLKSRQDLNGKDGVAECLTHSGRYIVKIEAEDGKAEKFHLKPSNLIAKNHCEISEPGSKEVTVNGLKFCLAHRFEICGAYATNFRLMNRLQAIGCKGDDGLKAVAEAMDKKESAENLPPLCAARAGEAVADRKPVPVKLNRKDLVGKGIALQPWNTATDGNLAPTFQAALSMHEHTVLRNEGYKVARHTITAPLFDLRRMLARVASDCDDTGHRFHELPEYMLQDEAMTEVILWDVVAGHREENQLNDSVDEATVAGDVASLAGKKSSSPHPMAHHSVVLRHGRL